MTKRYDVQIKVDGQWSWAGVQPSGMGREAARRAARQVRLHPYWRDQIRVTAVRVAEVEQ